jgi:Coenzyme PQQ synthesis protein D (PqqD)
LHAPHTNALSGLRARLPEHVIYRAFPAETVLLNVKTGAYHGVDTEGGRMLQTLERLGSLSDAATLLAEEDDRPLDQVEGDLHELCRSLAERGLLELHADDAG